MANVSDVEQLVELFATFFAEAQYKSCLEFKPEISTRFLTTAIKTGFAPYIVAEHNGRIIGTISYHIDDSFTDKLAVLGEVFVVREYRGTPVGRALVSAAMSLAKGDGADCMHIPLTSGHERMPTLVNLFKKFGAEEIGVVMRKVL